MDLHTHFDNPYLLSLTRKYSSKDIAASAQITLEKVFIKHINCLKPNTQLAVAGGVFANVKLNQIISENKILSHYIFFLIWAMGGCQLDQLG